MKTHIIRSAIILHYAVFLCNFAMAGDQPPYDIQEPFINENFRQIYFDMGNHIHDGTDSNKLKVFKSSASPEQFTGVTVYAGSTTLTANAIQVISPIGLTAIWLPIITEQNTSSKTVSCQAWTSSFTLTNTSGAETKIVNWWIFGKK